MNKGKQIVASSSKLVGNPLLRTWSRKTESETRLESLIDIKERIE